MTDEERRAPTHAIARGRPRTAAPRLQELSPEDGESAENQVFGSLKEALMSGRISPGAPLTTRPISEMLDVSPTPVREALRRLETIGALECRNRKAFFVKGMKKREWLDILEIRLSLEGIAMRRAIDNIKDTDVANISALNDVYKSCLGKLPINRSGILMANFDFHFNIYRKSNSRTLVEMIEMLWIRIGPALYDYVPTQSNKTIAGFHDRIVDALERRNAADAIEALTQDLVTAFEGLYPRLAD